MDMVYRYVYRTRPIRLTDTIPHSTVANATFMKNKFVRRPSFTRDIAWWGAGLANRLLSFSEELKGAGNSSTARRTVPKSTKPHMAQLYSLLLLVHSDRPDIEHFIEKR